MRGVKLAPTYQGFDPWSAEAWRIYAIANERRVPILWHQAAAFPKESMLEYANPVLLDRVARAFPELPMILAHFGLPWGPETVQLMRKHSQIFTDVSARLYRPWEMVDALMRAIEYRVTDRILFGSDFPIQTTSEALETFRALPDAHPGRAGLPRELIEDIITNRPMSLIWGEMT
jgi:predicted TIM-barrel fold metal-dependent hydrolase